MSEFKFTVGQEVRLARRDPKYGMTGLPEGCFGQTFVVESYRPRGDFPAICRISNPEIAPANEGWEAYEAMLDPIGGPW